MATNFQYERIYRFDPPRERERAEAAHVIEIVEIPDEPDWIKRDMEDAPILPEEVEWV